MRSANSHDREAPTVSKVDAAALLVIVVFLIFLAWFGAEFHFVEMCYSTEYDRYVEKADQLRQGILPKDPYHPLLYPILSAAAGSLLGDTFVGARTLSTLAAAGLLGLTYLVGRNCFTRKTAILTTIGLALNGLVIMCGVETATDMLFALLSMACLLLSLRLLKRPDITTVVALGACLALAYFTRYTAIAFVPCLALALWWSPYTSTLKRSLGALVLAITLVICLLPHLFLNSHIFGSPFFNRHADNLARKVMHWSQGAIQTGPEEMSVSSIVMGAPVEVVLSAAETAKNWIVDGLIGTVGGNRSFLPSAAFMVALLAGTLLSLQRTERRTRLLLIYVAVYFLGICIFMEPLPRLLIPILPVLMLLAVGFTTEDALAGKWSCARFSIPLWAPVMAVFFALMAAGASQRLSDMVQRHPYRELAAVRNLENAFGSHNVVAGTFPFLQRYTMCPYHHLVSDFGGRSPEDRELYFQRLRSDLEQKRVDYVIVGSPSLGERPVELLTGQGVPDFLSPKVVEKDLAVYRVRRDRL